MKKIHDYGYKYLFSHPGFVRQLLENFVSMEWVKEIDFSRMEKLNTSFIRKNLKNKESDVIYKLYSKEGPIYIYILLEFQSTVDYVMALRFQSYVDDVYEEINRKNPLRRGEKLPSVFPILIYNGDQKWDAPCNVRDLIAEFHPSLREYIPNLKYFPVIINEIPKKALLKIRNVLSAVFLIENLTEDEAEQYLDEAAKIIAHELPELREVFGTWFSHLVNAGRKPAFKNIQNLDEKESYAMFKTTLERIEKRGEKKGERQRQIRTAKKMFQKGMDIELISELTELSIAELEKILKK
jgi:predicted transposase/invertase (TIGR01784 family)